jgi:NAD(P)-dependent dehydrogenase (short-subunit alcohol dehydrogenase family)
MKIQLQRQIMQKRVLITGATDGIGLETAQQLIAQGHHVIIHGRSEEKLHKTQHDLLGLGNGNVETILADLSSFQAIDTMIKELAERYGQLDTLINNAGVYATPQPITAEGLDVRFMVNTIAPYMLTKALLPLFNQTGRIINLSSAAQAPVGLDALLGKQALSASSAYAQSKLALTMWSRMLGLKLKSTGPMLVSVNPKSLLGSKMVKQAYGIAGGDIRLGADILVRATLSEEFAHAHGSYFDNDIEMFSDPHPDALNDTKANQVLATIETIIDQHSIR